MRHLRIAPARTANRAKCSSGSRDATAAGHPLSGSTPDDGRERGRIPPLAPAPRCPCHADKSGAVRPPSRYCPRRDDPVVSAAPTNVLLWSDARHLPDGHAVSFCTPLHWPRSLSPSPVDDRAAAPPATAPSATAPSPAACPTSSTRSRDDCSCESNTDRHHTNGGNRLRRRWAVDDVPTASCVAATAAADAADEDITIGENQLSRGFSSLMIAAHAPHPIPAAASPRLRRVRKKMAHASMAGGHRAADRVCASDLSVRVRVRMRVCEGGARVPKTRYVAATLHTAPSARSFRPPLRTMYASAHGAATQLMQWPAGSWENAPPPGSWAGPHSPPPPPPPL
eukprot:ctg_1927.g414